MKLRNKAIIFVALLIPLLYGFTWLHEFGHVLGCWIAGHEVLRVEVNILGGAVYHTGNYESVWFISMMGSLLVLLVSIPFFIYSIKKENLWVMYVSWLQILNQIFYFGISVFIKHGDAYNIVEWSIYYNLKIVTMILYIIAIQCFIAMVGLLYIYNYFFKKKITKMIDEKYPLWQ